MMKRNLQEEQWAEKLKQWEQSTASGTWDRPSADGWDRIAENLPSEEKKRFVVWWRTGFVTLLLMSIGGASFFYVFQQFYANKGFSENNKGQLNKTETAVNLNNINTKTAFTPLETTVEKEEEKMSSSDRDTVVNTANDLLQNKNTRIEAAKNQEGNRNLILPIDKQQQQASEIKQMPPQASIEKIDNKTLQADTLSSNVVKSIIEIIDDHSLEKTITPLVNINSNNESELIPTLAFRVQTKETDLELSPLLSKVKHSSWSIDAYAQHSSKVSFRPFSPLWKVQKEKGQSYGLQINKTVGKGFSVHVGAQKREDVYTINGRFIRRFNTADEDSMGNSTFRFSTAVSGDRNIEEDVVVERNTGEPISSGTVLRFNVEREIAVNIISLPVGLSYTFWQAYPFQLSAVFGGEYSRVKLKSKRNSLAVHHAGFMIRRINTPPNHSNDAVVTTDFSLQAGLRLDVNLAPKVKTMVQVDWQGQTQKSLGALLNTGNQVRFGLSYDL